MRTVAQLNVVTVRITNEVLGERIITLPPLAGRLSCTFGHGDILLKGDAEGAELFQHGFSVGHIHRDMTDDQVLPRVNQGWTLDKMQLTIAYSEPGSMAVKIGPLDLYQYFVVY